MHYSIGMAHGIEITNMQARMAYADHSVPWHKLGTPVKGLQTISEMLRAANADFDVVTAGVAVVDADGNFLLNPDGTAILVKDSRATIRVNDDGTFNALSTVGTRYVVQQNREVLERALAVVGASRGDALVDTCGVLDEGREFFATLDLGSIFIDPNGINDRIDRYIVVRNGHDGKTPITFANTPIRAVCKNTVFTAIQDASMKVTARHTKNADTIVNDAQEVLRLSKTWSHMFMQSAEKMMQIPIDRTSAKFDHIVNTLFTQAKTESKTQRKNRELILEAMKVLYPKKTNAGGVGQNGWAMYNTIAEYLDHYREATKEERAIASMNTYSWVNKKKTAAQELILSLA